MEDRRIIELLLKRSETALDEISLKYSPLISSILGGLLYDNSDVEECQNDVLLAIWNSIPPNDPKNLCAYITKLAHRIGVDKLRYNTRSKRDHKNVIQFSDLEECLGEIDLESENSQHSNEISKILSDFIKSLDPESEILFVRRYVFLESVTSLAKRFELDENLVSVKLYRARKKLTKLLEKEGLYL